MSDMVSWDSLQGARYRLGNFEEFIKKTNIIYNYAVIALDNQLFDDMAKRSGLIDRTFNIVNKLSPSNLESPYGSYLPQYIERGLFYREMRQADSYELVRMDAVAEFEELKGSEDEFDSRVTARADELSGERLSEKVEKSQEAVKKPESTFVSRLSAFTDERSGFGYQTDNLESLIQLAMFKVTQNRSKDLI